MQGIGKDQWQGLILLFATTKDHFITISGDEPGAKKKGKKKREKKPAAPSLNPPRNDSPEDVAEVSVPVGPIPGGQRTPSTRNLEEMASKRNQVCRLNCFNTFHESPLTWIICMSFGYYILLSLGLKQQG